MYSLSDKYRLETERSVIDNIIYELEVDLSLLSMEAMGSHSVAAETLYPKAAPAAENWLGQLVTREYQPVRLQYASFEKDFLRFGSDRLRLHGAPAAGTGYLRQGYLSAAVSDRNGTFPGGLAVRFQLQKPLELPGVTFYADDLSDIYPVQYTVKTWLGGAVQETYPVEGNASSVLACRLTKACDRVDLIFERMNRPNTRARLFKVLFGLVRRFGNEEMPEGFSCEFDVDPTGVRLPQQQLRFSVQSGDYRQDDPKGLYRYLEQQQPVTARMRVRYRDRKEPEAVLPLCDMVLSGEVTGKKDVSSFAAVSWLQSAAAGNVCGTAGFFGLRPSSITLKSLLEAVFDQMKLPPANHGGNRWRISDALWNKPLGPVALPEKSYKDLVRQIVQAGACVVYEDGEGNLCVEKDPGDTTAYRVDFQSAYDVPGIKKYPPLQAVEVQIYQYTQESGTIKTAKRTYSYIEGCALKGEVQRIDNPLITSESQAKAVAEMMIRHWKRRDEYGASIRGGLELEPFDRILAQTWYAEGDQPVAYQPAQVLKRTLKFNGAVNSEVVYFTDPDMDGTKGGGV